MSVANSAGNRKRLRNSTGGSAGARSHPWKALHSRVRRGVELGGLFDALGDRVEAERSRHGKDGLDDRPRVGVSHHIGDEAAVQLQHVDGQAPQRGQRRVARAEVVDRDAHPQFSKRVERVQRPAADPPSAPIP